MLAAPALDPQFKKYEMIKEQQQRLSIGLHYSRSVVIPLGNNSGIFDELFDDLAIQKLYLRIYCLKDTDEKIEKYI